MVLLKMWRQLFPLVSLKASLRSYELASRRQWKIYVVLSGQERLQKGSEEGDGLQVGQGLRLLMKT